MRRQMVTTMYNNAAYELGQQEIGITVLEYLKSPKRHVYMPAMSDPVARELIVNSPKFSWLEQIGGEK